MNLGSLMKFGNSLLRSMSNYFGAWGIKEKYVVEKPSGKQG